MNTSLILLLIAMWMLGHAASSSSGRQDRRNRLRRPDSDDATVHGRHHAARHVVHGPGSSAAELLAKADGYGRAGKPLEARLCRKAAIQLEDNEARPVAGSVPMSEPEVVAAADTEAGCHSDRASVAA
jgi:hypothetical protein